MSALNSIRGHQPHVFKGQRGSILQLLLANRGRWIPSYRLADIALQYSARVKELRDAGYVIENRTKRVGRQVHGEFRLTHCPGDGEQLHLVGLQPERVTAAGGF